MYKTFLLIILFFWSHNASAYFDPATGSILLQGLLAALAGVWMTWRLFMEKIKTFLGMKKPDSEAENDDDKIQNDKS